MNDNNGGGGGKFVGFIAFVATMFAALLYLISCILSFFDISFPLFETLQSIATLILIIIVSFIGWKYVKDQDLSWKLVYTFILLAVVACVIVPVVMKFIPAAE